MAGERHGITRTDALAIARLARLHLTDEELERFTPQLNDILSHVAELAAADEEAGEAVVSPAEPAPLAADEPGPDPLQRGPESFAPAFEEGFFTLPRLGALDADALDDEGVE